MTIRPSTNSFVQQHLQPDLSKTQNIEPEQSIKDPQVENAVRLINRGKIDLAQYILGNILKKNPNHEEAIDAQIQIRLFEATRMIDSKIEEGEFDKAARLVQKKWRDNLELTVEQAYRWTSAQIQKVLEHDPNNRTAPKVSYYLNRDYQACLIEKKYFNDSFKKWIKDGKFEKTVERCQMFLQHYPKDLEVKEWQQIVLDYINVDKKLVEEGKIEAIRVCERFLLKFPKNEHVEDYLAMIKQDFETTAALSIAEKLPKNHSLRAACFAHNAGIEYDTSQLEITSRVMKKPS